MAGALIDLVIEKLRDGLLHDVKEEVEILSITLLSVQAVIEDAEKRQHTDKAIVVWLRRLKDTVYDAEDVLEVWSTHVQCYLLEFTQVILNQFVFLQIIGKNIKNVQADFDFITREILKYDLKTSVVISPEQNLNVLSRLMVVLKHTKDLVAIRGNWDMVAWLKIVRVRELQVDKIMKEFNEKTEELSPNDLDTKDVLYSELMESLTAVKVLIEEGKAGLKSIAVHLSSPKNYRQKLFSSEDLKKFTDFNKKLGSGGYSDVYQGKFQGEQVAVKVLKENGMVYETFLAERSTMGRIFHTNLVTLYGFCCRDDIKALVYEYMEKGSFDNILYQNPYSVEWSQLYGIALEIARGLAYLHGKGLIHHDVKAANVLLDKNLCPKITDFGVSNRMRSDATHITNTRTRGTDCYSAPEVYQPFSQLNCKCDVYSFGIMMFEIFGRRCSIPIKGKIWFPKEISQMWNEQPESVMEYCGIMEKDRENAKIVLMVAMWCAQYTPTIRPSMSDVVKVLDKEVSVTTPPYPFQSRPLQSHNLFGHLMLPSHKSLVVLKEYSQMDLEEFTSGFSNSNIIGTRSYGKMYRGKLSNGLQVAIKLFAHDFDIGKENFVNEVILMSKLQHRNIVKTYGYCFEKNMEALVYEYVPGGSLDMMLDNGIEWGWLYEIVIEIANGLSYLHDGCEEQIIHLDIKPSNILLNNYDHPKIKNFGWAKFIDISFRGTRGYAAPEVWMRRSDVPVSSKADVYSLGMVMFDVLGKRCNNQQSERWFPLQVWEKFETGQIEELIEACVNTRENREDAKILSKIALWCIQYTPDKRPSMETVVKLLKKSIPIPLPPKPFPDFVGIDDNGYIYDEDDYKKREESESLLKLYEEKCPPGGETSVVIYTTTIERMRRSFKESNEVRTILQSHQIVMIERDVYGDRDYEDELNDVLGKTQIPVLFVKGRLIGAADEVKRLEAEGKLKVLLYGIPTEYFEAKESSERMLELFEKMCPPGGENAVIIYTTTIESRKRPFQESNEVREILQSHDIEMIERDVWGDVGYVDELFDVMGKLQIPVLFVKGRLIGALDDVKRLEASGELKVLLYGL